MIDIKKISEVATAVGVLVGAFGLILTYLSMRQRNRWNQINHAMNLLEKWNPQTLIHRQAIEKRFPHILDINETLDSSALEAENKQRHDQVEQIYGSHPESDDWKLKFHILELLNFFELVSVAYENSVVSRKTLARSFGQSMIRYHDTLLKYFMQTAHRKRGYNPWKPYESLVKRWNEKGLDC